MKSTPCYHLAILELYRLPKRSDTLFQSQSGVVFASGRGQGMKFRPMANEVTIIPQGERKIISTSIAITTPADSYAQIAPRSGLAAKHSIDIGAGVIDQDYWGEIKVLLINNSKHPYPVKPGDGIAQLILERILLVKPQETNTLDKTIRGKQGFGSTRYQQNLTHKINSLTAEDFDKSFLERVKKSAVNDKEYQEELSKDPANQQGLIFFQKRLRIPVDQELRKEILESEHDHPTAGHFGQRKTLELVMRNFYWPNMV